MQLQQTCLLVQSNVKNMGTATCLLVIYNCLISDTYALPVPYNQTCVMVNKSAEHKAMMLGY